MILSGVVFHPISSMHKKPGTTPGHTSASYIAQYFTLQPYGLVTDRVTLLPELSSVNAASM